jgi:ribose 1,5-bisphosphokinase PhnN
MALVVRELLDRGVSVVAEGNFTPAWSLLREPPACRLCQVHVTAAPDVLRSRLQARDTHRHPVHYDGEAAAEIAERAARGEWAALPLTGQLVEIDTSVTFPEVSSILSRSVFG